MKLLLNYIASHPPHHLCQKQFPELFMRNKTCFHPANVEIFISEWERTREQPAFFDFRSFKCKRRTLSSHKHFFRFTLQQFSSNVHDSGIWIITPWKSIFKWGPGGFALPSLNHKQQAWTWKGLKCMKSASDGAGLKLTALTLKALNLFMKRSQLRRAPRRAKS